MNTFWRPDRGGAGVALLRQGHRWVEYRDPVEMRTANSIEEVGPLLEWAEAKSATKFVVGFVSFDAAPAFDTFLVVEGAVGPLARFAVYESGTEYERLTHGGLDDYGGPLKFGIGRNQYVRQIAKIKEVLRAGRTYQVNHTFRMRGTLTGDPSETFCTLCEAHVPEFGALLIYDDLSVLSLSPELFFHREGENVTTRPMKGTRLSSGDPAELQQSEKDRAENLMIVDMIRNDLGRVAEVGTVNVPELFQVKQHGTVLQMTSTITAQVKGSTASLFGALFPCASVVGAPKVETMKVISELESSPRGIYCGAIGMMGPDSYAQFNVAIRTLVIRNGAAEYGVGGGIVWDSDPLQEWDECHNKMRALDSLEPCALLETAIWDGNHLSFEEARKERMTASAHELGFPEIEWPDQDHGYPPRIVRARLARGGKIEVQNSSVDEFPTLLSAKLCPWPVDSESLKLRHKTTRRGVYERAMRDCPNADDVLLWNARGEVTEFTIANAVFELDGRLITPPVECGLLPGLARTAALEQGLVKEGVVKVADLDRVEAIWHLNSVRGWTRVRLY